MRTNPFTFLNSGSPVTTVAFSEKVIRKATALIGIGLSLLALLSVLFILVKGWGLRTPLKEGVSTMAGVAEQALQRIEGGAARLRAPVEFYTCFG